MRHQTPDAEAAPGFQRSLASHRLRYEDLWWEVEGSWPEPWPAQGRRQRKKSLKQIEAFLRSLPADVAACPSEGAAREKWREGFRDRLLSLGAECLGWPTGYADSLLGESTFGVTKAFALRAREEVPGLASEDLFQALRNLWIMNGLQLIHGLPVELTPPTFAYSMLYPLTDNLLDAADVSAGEKSSLGRDLGRRLAGRPVLASGGRLERIFHMVGLIEDFFPRSEFSGVYSSLLAIHQAQMSSLGQQGSAAPYELDLLGLSLAKGGASVLADGYLVAGKLTAEQEDFCYGYGVFLQLLDDLQDIEEDRRKGHQTLFSQSAGHWPLDGLACRVYHLMCRVLEGSPYAGAPHYPLLKDLIHRNSTQLLLQAVAANRRYFSADFVRRMEAYSPVPFSSRRRLRRHFEGSLRRYRQLAGVGGEGELWSVLGS